jgi:transposase
MRSIDYLDLDKNSFIFQHNNAPCHTSKNVLECLRKLGITILKWPPQSPDLNPIEHLWDHLKRQLAKYGTPTSGAIDLWDRVLEEWWKIEDKTCLHLISLRLLSMLKEELQDSDIQYKRIQLCALTHTHTHIYIYIYRYH